MNITIFFLLKLESRYISTKLVQNTGFEKISEDNHIEIVKKQSSQKV